MQVGCAYILVKQKLNNREFERTKAANKHVGKIDTRYTTCLVKHFQSGTSFIDERQHHHVYWSHDQKKSWKQQNLVEKCSRRSSTRIMILLQPLNRRGVYDLPSPLLLRLKYRQQKRKGKDPRLQFYLNIRKRRFFRCSIAKDSSKLNCFPAQRERDIRKRRRRRFHVK